jgi:hypothetical protein
VRRAAEARLVRRLGEAIELLAPAGIVVTSLDAGQATAVLASACNPDTFLPPSAALAGADEVITTAGTSDLADDEFSDTRFRRGDDDPAEYGDEDADDDWDYGDDGEEEDERGRWS